MKMSLVSWYSSTSGSGIESSGEISTGKMDHPGSSGAEAQAKIETPGSSIQQIPELSEEDLAEKNMLQQVFTLDSRLPKDIEQRIDALQHCKKLSWLEIEQTIRDLTFLPNSSMLETLVIKGVWPMIEITEQSFLLPLFPLHIDTMQFLLWKNLKALIFENVLITDLSFLEQCTQIEMTAAYIVDERGRVLSEITPDQKRE